ncbi:MAG: deoxyhypusine synthase family protein [Planctomycetota bacterium]|nr:deoxyhypusine synthase family protein [Planctomycetota bacterium]
MAEIKDYLRRTFKHFNAAVVVDAARAWEELIDAGGKMLLSMGGAMSTAEIGISLAELIRQKKVHALCVTGANLEEDVYNLIAHKSYRRVPNYRELGAREEMALCLEGFNRVTDTCIPENAALQKIDRHMLALWHQAETKGERLFPYEFFYRLLASKVLEPEYEIDPRDSWLLAACDAELPIWTPGWEDSTLGNTFVSMAVKGEISDYSIVKNGLEQMRELIDWYVENDKQSSLGFFQIGGGITGDFAICVVPILKQDLKLPCDYWRYFCQISDSTTSYGSYSGAVPNEKITWGKIDVDTPRFVIESDATVVFPLIAAYLLDR